MFIFRFLFLFLCSFSLSVYAGGDRYVVSASSGFSEDNQQTYGISSYETLGKGRWGLYGEMLFSSQGDVYQNCEEQCDYVDISDRQFNFTVGGTYGFTNSFYGLVGAGLRMRGISTSPYNNASVCDPEDEPDDGGDGPSVEPMPIASNGGNGEQYCSSNTDLGIAAQVGLLYITPIGLSFSGTIDTEKTATLSVGYQF